MIRFRPLPSTVLENKDRHHVCSGVKLPAIFTRGEGIEHHILGLI